MNAEVKMVIEIPTTLKEIADDGDLRSFGHCIWQMLLFEAIRGGEVLSDECDECGKESE